jgi:hypothetical protein
MQTPQTQARASVRCIDWLGRLAMLAMCALNFTTAVGDENLARMTGAYGWVATFCFFMAWRTKRPNQQISEKAK